VVVEVDGPYHFAINTRHPTGATLIRCRGRVRQGPCVAGAGSQRRAEAPEGPDSQAAGGIRAFTLYRAENVLP